MQEAVEADTRGDLAAARQLYYRALLDLPDDPQIWINLGALFRSQKNFALSLAAQSKAFALDPDNLATCTNLANILDDVGDHGRAVVLRGKLAGARPDDPDSFALLIRSMRAAGQLDLAEQTATSALQRFPDHPKIRFELGFQFLAQRRYAEGFLHYLTRRATGQVRLPDTEIPRWTGADPQGKRILVLPEQGFGDTINFCRFLPFLKARGATVHLLTRPAAHRRKLRVGCVWTGSEGYDRNDMRSFPHTYLLGLARIPGVQLFSLYKGPFLQSYFEDGTAAFVLDTASTDRDLADCAATIAEMDLVITADTVTAHIAGALGVEVWNLLHWEPFWLYGLTGETTDWYPSMTLFRQSRANDWAEIFDAVGERLKARATAKAEAAI